MFKSPVFSAILLLVHTPLMGDYAVALAHMRSGDYASAYRELRELADRGYPVYQNMVARMHLEGKGVPADKVMAHAWYWLSASQGDELGKKEKAKLEVDLTPTELLESRRLAEELGALYVAPLRPHWELGNKGASE